MNISKSLNVKRVFVSVLSTTIMIIAFSSMTLTAFAEDDGWNDIDLGKAEKCASSCAIGGAVGGAVAGAMTGGTVTIGTMTVPAAVGGAVTGAAGGYASGFISSIWSDLQK